MHGKTLVSVVVLLLLAVSSAGAIGRGPGARAAAMGGAYSAIADGIESYSWNPAGIATTKNFTFNAAGGGDLNLTLQEAQDLYNQLQTGDGRKTYLASHLFKEIKINTYADIPVGISFNNFGLVAGTKGFLYTNKETIDVQIMILGEYRLEYALMYGNDFSLIGPNLKNIYWGTTLRGYNGSGRLIYYNAALALLGSNYIYEFSEEARNGLSADLGLKYEGKNYAVALAAKDLSSGYDSTLGITTREVDFVNGTIGDTVSMGNTTLRVNPDPTWLLGIAYYLEELGVLFATDIERYKTTVISPSDSQFGETIDATDIHVGIEKKINDWFALRSGYSMENRYKLQLSWLTYGFGFNFGPWSVDLAAGSSQKSSQVYLQVMTML